MAAPLAVLLRLTLYTILRREKGCRSQQVGRRRQLRLVVLLLASALNHELPLARQIPHVRAAGLVALRQAQALGVALRRGALKAQRAEVFKLQRDAVGGPA